MVKGKKFILLKHFSGFPKVTDVQLQEEDLPPLQDGQFLCETLYISVDPYQRAYRQNIGNVVMGSQVARIIDSKNPNFPVGKYLTAYYGWKTHHILDGYENTPSKLRTPSFIILPDDLDVPLSYFLGILGLTGLSAYFGFLNICNPQPGETVVVTGAAGAVGSVVGQIAKIKGCKVIGVVGSDEKGHWITKDLGFDAFINYKTDKISKALKELAPEGVDCYFDNLFVSARPNRNPVETEETKVNNGIIVLIKWFLSRFRRSHYLPVVVHRRRHPPRFTMLKGKKYILQHNFNGFPKKTDVLVQEEDFPALRDGEFLCESLYISVDPYQRCYPQNVGDVVLGAQVARVIDSKNPKYPVGKHVVANYGWKTHHILDGSPSMWGSPPMIVPENLDVPLSYFLGVFGHTGLSAYFGLLNICKPQPGETVVVSGAAGAVGSVAGQIAKIKGCKVIGIVGSEEKGHWITKELGFDGFINYKKDNLCQALNELAAEGIDCYFDNVGGDISSQILKHMNTYGRIAVCGSISNYNDTEESKVPAYQLTLIFKQLKMEGFLLYQYEKCKDEGIKDNIRWFKEGKLKTHETITKGFENTFDAFTDMLKGLNVGKALVEL